MANTADTTYSLVRETVAGTTPATPAFKYLDTTDASMSIESTWLSSEVMKANRAAGDSVEQGFYVTGNVKTDFRPDSTVDMLLEGGFGGTFSSGVLKAGSVDLSHTFEQKMVGSGGPLYFRNTGCLITSLGLTVDAKSKVALSADFMGLAQTHNTAIITGATYAAPVQGPLFSGGGAGSITINGFTGTYYSLDLKVAHTRSAKMGLFNPNAVAISTGGNRAVTLSMVLYRDDFSPETVFAPNTPIAASFSFGSGAGNVYTFNLARTFAKRPKNGKTENDETVTIELMGVMDGTAGTDLSCVKS